MSRYSPRVMPRYAGGDPAEGITEGIGSYIGLKRQEEQDEMARTEHEAAMRGREIAEYGAGYRPTDEGAARQEDQPGTGLDRIRSLPQGELPPPSPPGSFDPTTGSFQPWAALPGGGFIDPTQTPEARGAAAEYATRQQTRRETVEDTEAAFGRSAEALEGAGVESGRAGALARYPGAAEEELKPPGYRYAGLAEAYGNRGDEPLSYEEQMNLKGFVRDEDGNWIRIPDAFDPNKAAENRPFRTEAEAMNQAHYMYGQEGDFQDLGATDREMRALARDWYEGRPTTLGSYRPYTGDEPVNMSEHVDASHRPIPSLWDTIRGRGRRRPTADTSWTPNWPTHEARGDDLGMQPTPYRGFDTTTAAPSATESLTPTPMITREQMDSVQVLVNEYYGSDTDLRQILMEEGLNPSEIATLMENRDRARARPNG